MAVLIGGVGVASLCVAAQQGVVAPPVSAAQQGTTADFAQTYPFVMLAFVAALLLVVGYFLVERDRGLKDANIELKNQLQETNGAIAVAVEKMEGLINTLFDRDYGAEEKISAIKSEVAGIKATCAARQELCRAMHMAKPSGPANERSV